jgi:hypothetical protein
VVEDKRKLKRRELLYNLKIYDVETGELAGWVVDASAEGVKIVGEESFDKKQFLELTIELPEDVFGKRKIGFSAQVQWCKPDVNPDLTASGLQFITISPDDHEALIGLMAQYSLTD